MKKFNLFIIGTVVMYGCLSVLLFFVFQTKEVKDNLQYKVEINEIIKGLETQSSFSEPDLQDMEFVREVAFLSLEEMENEEKVKEFYRNKNGANSLFQPYFAVGFTDGSIKTGSNDKERLLGYLRFDYQSQENTWDILWLTEGILLFAFLFIFLLLLYVKNKIMGPFHMLSDMPYELSKGHLRGELEESRNRFFGKFIWGISMLRDTLNETKSKELKLEKDKKMLLLSLSHDIKIPLSTIKLYAKALSEGVYDSEEKKLHAARQIEKHSLEIEDFVKEIMNTSKEDIISIEVNNSEFYLKEYIDRVKKYYEPKYNLSLTEFSVGKYENKLLSGDIDRALEVMENLLENALKYGDGRKVSISFYEEDYCQVIKVFNTGIPIAAEEMPHLFDSFYRGSNTGEKDGNGLGLYIARQIMRKMEGDIFAERETEGMSFCLVFRL